MKNGKKNKQSRRVILLILDGWGINKPYEGNAIHRSKTPTYDKLWHSCPRAVLDASGLSVGLPEGQMGTSEVNHMTIGAGRVIFQDLTRIKQDLKNQSFVNNKAFIKAFRHVKENNSTLHIKGLFSPGGVHSHQDHFFALVKAAKLYGIKKLYLHLFTDGRDTPVKSAVKYVKELEQYLKDIGLGKIASISGRYYAMDRDNNWDRTDQAFDIMTKAAQKKSKSAIEAIKAAYAQDIYDEFIKPTAIEVEPGEEGTISSNDAVIFVNFRTDRPKQLVKRFIDQGPNNIHYVTMTQYNPDFSVHVAYEQKEINNVLGEILAKNGITQLRITETEKFNHLTYFLNCRRSETFEGEDRILLDSYSDIKTHDEKPEMRTPDIAQQIIEDIHNHTHDVIISNLCNADMVGHTTDMKAAMKGCETVDKAIKKIIKAIGKKKIDLLITADHGNAEEMIDEKSGEKISAHSTNPVPFILYSNKYKKILRDKGTLIDIAPTILKIFGVKKPKEMTGHSFI